MARFSQSLQKLLSSRRPITLQMLIDGFAEKSFAILLLLLLAVPALPLPTGGVTHIFEVIAMLVVIELIIGRKSVWLPKSWLRKDLPRSLQTVALPRFIKTVAWIEKYSKPRLRRIQASSLATKIEGIFILIFTVFAFLAPPFTGLDTLPSLGVVLLSLALIFEDILLTAIGVVVGSVGIVLIFLLGKLAFQLL